VTGLRKSRGRGPTVGEQSTSHTVPRTAAAVLVLAAALTTAPVRANEHDLRHDRFVREARAMMAELRAESRRDAERIAAAYGEGAAAFVFGDFAALTASTQEGVIRTLPVDEYRFNIRPRLTGAHPIGEKDPVHQATYVAARPATLGVLLQVASRVRSTHLEVTSLVRHQEYQRALQRTNPNARTALPAHAMGLAFDISILNVPMAAAREIRDVLRQMRDDGELFFIAETRQLVFHVVPAPRRAQFHAAAFSGLTEVPAPAWALPPPPAFRITRAAEPRDIPLTPTERRLAWLLRAAPGTAPLPYAAIGVWVLVGLAMSHRRRA
jgi:hypothetical protein